MILFCPPASVSLRFFHPNIDPTEISEAVGIHPTHSWKLGVQRQTPKGRLLSGVRAESYWCGELGPKPDESLSELLKRWGDLLAPYVDWLSEFRRSGGRVELYVALIGSENAGNTLPPTLLLEMGRLGIELGLEIFPVPQSD